MQPVTLTTRCAASLASWLLSQAFEVAVVAAIGANCKNYTKPLARLSL
jgi:hypothetical protein